VLSFVGEEFAAEDLALELEHDVALGGLGCLRGVFGGDGVENGGGLGVLSL
jgi:hypothetical protein